MCLCLFRSSPHLSPTAFLSRSLSLIPFPPLHSQRGGIFAPMNEKVLQLAESLRFLAGWSGKARCGCSGREGRFGNGDVDGVEIGNGNAAVSCEGQAGYRFLCAGLQGLAFGFRSRCPSFHGRAVIVPFVRGPSRRGLRERSRNLVRSSHCAHLPLLEGRSAAWSRSPRCRCHSPTRNGPGACLHAVGELGWVCSERRSRQCMMSGSVDAWILNCVRG